MKWEYAFHLIGHFFRLGRSHLFLYEFRQHFFIIQFTSSSLFICDSAGFNLHLCRIKQPIDMRIHKILMKAVIGYSLCNF